MSLGQFLTNKRIPTIIGLLILISGVIGGVVLVASQQGLNLNLRAGPTSTPRQVRVTNVTETDFTVSWISDTRVSGFVRYGTESNSLSKVFADDRDQISGKVGLFTVHYVTVKGLKANTQYFFKVGSGSQQYDNEGQPWEITTAKAGVKPAADTISGKIVLAAGQPAEGVVVYVEIEGGFPMSSLSKKTGTWNIPLSQMRSKDLSGYLKYDTKTAKVTIFAQGADLGNATAIVNSENDNPVADITLGQNHDFQAGASGSGTLSAPSIMIQNNTYVPSELTLAAGQTVSVVNNDPASHSATAKNREFTTGLIAAGGNGTFIAPSAPGTYNFYDNQNPQLESLVGTLTIVSVSLPQTAADATPVTPATPSVVPGSQAGFSDLSAATEATYSVKIASPEINSGVIATAAPEIKIKGPVGTKVKITVHSDEAQSTNAIIGPNGEVLWTPPSDLEPGEHTVTVEYVDENGVPQQYTKTFTVLAVSTTPTPTSTPTPTPTKTTLALAATPTYSASPSAKKTTPTASASARSSMPSTASGIPDAGVLTPTIILLTLGIGLFLAGLGWQVKLMPKNSI